MAGGGTPFPCQLEDCQASGSSSVNSLSVKFGKNRLKVDRRPYLALSGGLWVLQVEHKIFAAGEELSREYFFSITNLISCMQTCICSHSRPYQKCACMLVLDVASSLFSILPLLRGFIAQNTTSVVLHNKNFLFLSFFESNLCAFLYVHANEFNPSGSW